MARMKKTVPAKKKTASKPEDAAVATATVTIKSDKLMNVLKLFWNPREALQSEMARAGWKELAINCGLAGVAIAIILGLSALLTPKAYSSLSAFGLGILLIPIAAMVLAIAILLITLFAGGMLKLIALLLGKKGYFLQYADLTAFYMIPLMAGLFIAGFIIGPFSSILAAAIMLALVIYSFFIHYHVLRVVSEYTQGEAIAIIIAMLAIRVVLQLFAR